MSRSLRIAIADDDRSTREVLKQLLADLGHEVVAVAESGRDLIRKVAEVKPDIVVTDNFMDDIDGVDAALEIFKARPVPIILLSAYCNPQIVRHAEEKHVLVYLVKPISQAHLELALEKCVDQWGALMRSEQGDGNETIVTSRHPRPDSRSPTGYARPDILTN
jgi:CheY-like chemotaxis protein